MVSGGAVPSGTALWCMLLRATHTHTHTRLSIRSAIIPTPSLPLLELPCASLAASLYDRRFPIDAIASAPPSFSLHRIGFWRPLPEPSVTLLLFLLLAAAEVGRQHQQPPQSCVRCACLLCAAKCDVISVEGQLMWVCVCVVCCVRRALRPCSARVPVCQSKSVASYRMVPSAGWSREGSSGHGG